VVWPFEVKLDIQMNNATVEKANELVKQGIVMDGKFIFQFYH